MQSEKKSPRGSASRYLLLAGSMALVGALALMPGCQKEISTKDEPVLESKSAHMSKNLKTLDLEVVAEGLTSPLGLLEVPDGSNRRFIYDQIGLVHIVDAAGNVLPTPFMDLRDRMVTLNAGFDERGLIGFTFHPDYATNGRFFVYYQAPPRPGGPPPTATNPNPLWNNLSVISEFRVMAGNPNRADMTSERRLIQMDDPQLNHNGGTLAFGPDGYLYIAIGDGGGANDVGPGHVEDWYAANAGGNGQDLEANLFGNILRIDVNSGNPYGIPADNPFVGKAGRDEIYAYGLRNPYRMSFDMSGSRKLYAGDAGQLLYEEIDVIEKGQNYGWNVKEGTHCFNAAASLTELASCPDFDPLGNRLIDPVIELNNFRNPKGGKASTVIGGNVYRGHTIPQLQGKYIFGTFSQGVPAGPNAELFVANPAGPGPWAYQELTFAGRPNDLGYFLKGFGQDLDGEIYLAVSTITGPTGTTGKILKLVLAD